MLCLDYPNKSGNDNSTFTPVHSPITQKALLNFIVDFYCAKLKLAIEIDGETHAEQKDYDDARTLKLNKYGINIIRYFNHDVLNDIEGVYGDLKIKFSELEYN